MLVKCLYIERKKKAYQVLGREDVEELRDVGHHRTLIRLNRVGQILNIQKSGYK